MYITATWLVIGIVVLAWAAYKIGYKTGRAKGYDDYDREIAEMEAKGDVVFPGKPVDSDD